MYYCIHHVYGNSSTPGKQSIRKTVPISNNEHNNGYGNIGTVLVKLRKQAATVYRAGILFLIRSVSDI